MVWERHANYETFASVESIPSRQEITELANDLVVEAEAAAAGTSKKFLRWTFVYCKKELLVVDAC
jgi:hypothetical protein